ncbi:MAG: fumarylacetoacetate hydrolase family protein [Lysobacterales bacterium]
MHLFKTTKGIVLQRESSAQFVHAGWDSLISNDDLHGYLCGLADDSSETATEAIARHLEPPIGTQEIWACGVSYYNSQMARREEAEAAGGGDFYARVYHAERPELFFKSTAHRAAGHQQAVRIRRDSSWNVPEPELTLVVSPSGKILGYTVGNDMSSRSIEGENPLYLPQAKTYEQSAGIGPGILVAATPLSPDTEIRMSVFRDDESVFCGQTKVSAINRTFVGMVAYLYRELEFPVGAYLMTGTGIVPASEFTLEPGDRIEIEITAVGKLVQTVVRG